MDSVWMVVHSSWEGITILGIYDSEEKANALVEKFYDGDSCVSVLKQKINTPGIDSDARVPWEVCFYRRTGNINSHRARLTYPHRGGIVTSIPEVDASGMAAEGATVAPVSSDDQFMRIRVWAKSGYEAVQLATDKFSQVMRGSKIVNSGIAGKESDNEVN